MRNGKVNAMSELHFKEVAAISKSFYLSKLVQGGDQSGKWIYAGFWADSKSHRRLFFFFLSFSSRYPQKDSPLNKMSAFSIRKQSPNQSGNTESPSFSLWALKSLKHSLLAFLFASTAIPIAQLPFQGTPPLFGRGHASYGIHRQTHVSCKASSVVCKLLLAEIQAKPPCWVASQAVWFNRVVPCGCLVETAGQHGGWEGNGQAISVTLWLGK